MKTRCATAVCIAALLCVAGCSNDPTSDRFKTFAEDYATKISGEKVGKDGVKRTVKADLTKFNLEKTNSLTVPFVGTAEYEVVINGLTVRSTRLKGYATPAICHNKSTVRFGWVDNQWQPQDGDTVIAHVEFPNLTMNEVVDAKLDEIYNPNSLAKLSAAAISKGNAWLVNGFFTETEQEFDDRYLKPARERMAAEKKDQEQKQAAADAIEAALPQTVKACLEEIASLLEPLPQLLETYQTGSYVSLSTPGSVHYVAKQDFDKRISSAVTLIDDRLPVLASRESLQMIAGKSIAECVHDLTFSVRIIDAYLKEPKADDNIPATIEKAKSLVRQCIESL